LIISGHNIPKGKVVDEFAELVDIAPTLLNYAGVTPSPEMGFEGRNLLDIVNDPDAEWRDAVFCEGNFMSAPHQMFKPFYPFVQTEIDGVRGWEYEKLEKIADEKGLDLSKLEGAEGPYKYWRPIIKTIRTKRYSLSVRAIWHDGQGEDYMGSLYDLEKDPCESINLFDEEEYSKVKNDLIEKLKGWDSK
jgi:arylsulfatase A-like enzyme